MAQNTIYRGDSDSWTLSVPLTVWSAGGKFFFAVKPKGSLATVDLTDASAQIKKTYDDTFITSTDAVNKNYTLTLTHTDTVNTTPGKYIAEFQWVNAAGTVVQTFGQFKYTIIADVNQRIS